MTDQPHVSPYPPDELGRLAARMIEVVGKPGVRGVVMLDDDTVDTGMVVPFGYDISDRHSTGFMFGEVADHVVNLWRAFGMRLDLVINGKTMPVHPVHELGDLMADNGRDRHIVSGFLQALETRVAALEAGAETALHSGELEAAKLRTAFAAELKALAAEITSVFQDL